MFEKIITTLSNPILFYADKEGHAVFRNFNWFGNCGCSYDLQLSKIEVGKVLEYRFDIEKHLKIAYWLVPIIIYLIFIHTRLSFWNLLVAEFFWILIIGILRAVCAYVYSDYLIKNFGQYKVVDFVPHMPKEKWQFYRRDFYNKIILIGIVIVLFFAPAFALQYGLKLCSTSHKKHAKVAMTISEIYNAFYPKTSDSYDLIAYVKYAKHDYKGALDAYKTSLEMTGKHFSQKDLSKFANLLFLEKKISSPEDAVVLFDDYATRKNMTVLEQSKMLWIKSIFSIENNMPDAIVADYDSLLESLSPKDMKNRFYITSDKAYILYLMKDYENALANYDVLINYAENNKKQFGDELKSLYAERGFTKKRLGDTLGADGDFAASGIDIYEIDKYEPSYSEQQFVVDEF